MASVEIKNVRKSYGSVDTIHGVSVGVSDGDFVVLVGPSGCGKSTLLRMIAGLEEITGGEILIGDRVINDVEPKHRDIAMVFQNYALYPHMTIAQNMGFSLRLARKSKDEIDQRVKDAARILGLTDYLERFPKQLSGGQRQRVAMGRAIVRNPQVFLFDEPLSNLDAKLRVQMRTELKDLHARLKTTTIYVTHDQIEAMTMADKIVVMRDGVVEQFGEPLELYDRPANRFVAGFIGSPSMNFLDGTVVVRDGKQMFESANHTVLPLPEGLDRTFEGKKLIMGFRPEHLQVSEAPEVFEVTVSVVEPTGAETYFVGNANGDTITGVLRDRIAIASGQSLRLLPRLNAIHLFDAETEQRVN